MRNSSPFDVIRRTARRRSPAWRAWRTCLAAFLLAAAAAGAGSIFDDDWTPPRRSETAAPATAVPTARPTTRATALVPGSAAPPAAVAPPSVGAPRVAPPAADAVRRRPVPGAAEQDKSRRLMKDVFSKELADRAPAARKALAQKLLDESAKVADTPSDQYVLLGGAIQSAVEAGDLPLALEAADRVAGVFDLDALAVKANVAAKMSPKGYAADAAGNVPEALGLLDQLEAADDLVAASRLAAVLQQVPLTDAPLRATVLRRAKEIDEARASRERLGPALEKLKTSPDDPAANAAVGRYTALLLGNWERGLPLLAKGDDPKLAALAKAALAAPADAAGRAKLADGWWDLAQTSAGRAKAILLQRAVSDYQLALPGLAGLARVMAEKRLAEAEATAGAGAAGATTAARAGGTVHLLPLVNDRDLANVGWSRQGPAVVSDAHGDTSLVLAYAPPDEYDFTAEFSRLSGDGDILLAFPVGPGTCNFSVGAGHNLRALLGKINANWTSDNPTVTEGAVPNDQRHRIEVKVRRDGVGGYLDGRRLCYWKTNGDDLMGFRAYMPHSPGLLALASWHSSVAFYSADVTPVHGTGAIARERDADGWLYNPVAVRPGPGGAIVLRGRDASVHGKELTFDSEPDSGEAAQASLQYWSTADDYVTWFVEAPKAADYSVELTYSCADSSAGSEVELQVSPAREAAAPAAIATPAAPAAGPGAAPLTFQVQSTGSWRQYHAESAGTLHLSAGRQMLSVKTKSKPGKAVMNLRQITLTPAR